MAQQQSFLPKTSFAAADSSVAASALRRTLNGKSLSRLSILFATVGAFAFLQHAGFTPNARSERNDNVGRSLTLENEDVVVTTIDERVLQVAVNGIAEGYYREKSADYGRGACVDSNNPPRGYDYSRYLEITAEKCARRCSKSLLLSEHRGFNYDDASNDCCCLYDDHRIPLSEQRKAPEFNVDFNGLGPISGANADKGEYQCFEKDTASIGAPIESYRLEACSNDAEDRDSVVFGAVDEAVACAEKCVRFKLFATHVGFTHQTDTCVCLFHGGEAPSVRKLTGSGAVSKRRQKYAERYADMGDAAEAVCYSKPPIEGAPVEDRLSADTSQRVWINEFHYRNAGVNQPFIEIIGPNGIDASDYEVVVYQGRNGAVHHTVSLTGTFAGNGDWGFVTIDLDSTEIRKGKQGGDGLGLVRKSDSKCLQLLSYTDAEGVDRSFTATEGGCADVASEPTGGKFEHRQTPLGQSLQLVGTGNTLSAFEWNSPGPASKGEVNTGQELTIP